MSLTPLHKHLVRRTFTQLVTHDVKVLSLFRQRLRELDPALLSLFIGDPLSQPHRPLGMLALVISLLDNPAALRPQLKTIQAHQARDNISGENLTQIADALLWVVEQELGDAFTADVQVAWLEFYQYLADLSGELS